MSRTELIDILKAFFALSLAFTILLGGLGENFVNVFLIAALTVGIAFLFHELAHRAVARKYGLHAEFRAFDLGLVIAIVMSFFGFIFAAPGAVMIRGYARREKIGKIAAAGPATNIVLAIIFLFFSFFFSASIIKYGFFINSFLAFFNLLPFAMFDGAKVFYWNRKVFSFLIGAAFVLLLLQYAFGL